MEELPIKLKKYFSQESLDSSTTVSYWVEFHKEEKGALGLFVSISGSNGLSVERIAKFMWDSFRESYLDSSGTASENLKISIKGAQRRLMDLIKNEAGISDVGLDIHLCGILIIDEKIYLSKVGAPEVLLIRENKMLRVSDHLPGYDVMGYKSEIPVGSFDLRKSDIFLFSTPKLAESIMDLFDEDEPISWDSLLNRLDSFSGNLIGSQYVWLIGFRIDDTPKIDFQRPDEIQTNIEKIKEGELMVDEEALPVEPQREAEAPFNLKQFVTSRYLKLKEIVLGLDFQAIKRSFSAKVSSLKVGGRLKRKMFIQKNNALSFDSGDKKRKLIGGVLIISILVIVFLSIRAQRNKSYNEEVESDIDNIQSDIDEAKDIWKSDEMQANEILSSVDTAINKLEKKDLDDGQSKKVEKLRQEALSVKDQINRVTPVKDDENYKILIESYLDIDESANITDIVVHEGYLYLVDYSTHGIYRYDIGGKGIEAVANSQDVLKEPVLMAIGDQYIFVYDNKLGMFSLDMEMGSADQEFSAMPELSAKTVGDVVDIETFGDNIYILKSDEARVLKSYPSGTGYSYPEEYFRHGAFDKSKDLMIDGNIYVLSNSSDKVYKFYGGIQDTFTLGGLDKDLGSVTCGFTNVSDSRPLYIYDSDNSRIVVIEKGTSDNHPGQGVMINQYIYRGSRDDILKDVKEIVVDSEEKNMYVLDDTRVLSISL